MFEAARLGALVYDRHGRRLSGDGLGIEPPYLRPSAAAALLGILALMGFGVVLARPAPAMARVAKAKPVVLAVWAHVNNHLPVAGATVRVYATARPPASWRGQPPARLLVRPSAPARAQRTYRTGAALLEFSHLPRTFTIEVMGGRAAGRSLPGRFSVVVRDYASGTVVDVNPVTTLVADDLAGLRGLPVPAATARARAQIYRLLRLPGWEDQIDLRYSMRYFDGASYLAAARRAGSIGKLERGLIAQARRGSHHPFLGAAATIVRRPRLRGPIASAAALPATGAGLISQVFRYLAAQAGSSLASVAGEKAGTAALGWVLAAFGYGDVLKDEDVAEIRRIVEQLNKQVAQLQGQVSQLQRDLGVIGFSTLLHQTDRTIGQIDHATSQLALLASMPARDPTKPAFTQTIVDYIGANLLDAPAILNRGLGSHLPLADNVIKSSSRALAQRKFYGPQSSAEVRSVYEYFAAYQVQLSILLQEYYHAKPTVYSPANNAANLARVQADVEAQAGSLKPDVPANTVIDTKTGEMWVTDLPSPDKRLSNLANVIGANFKFAWITNSEYSRDCGHGPPAGPTGISGFPYCNWELPSADAYRRLIEGWSGTSPSHWLRQQAGFSDRILSAFGNQKWIRDNYKIINLGGALTVIVYTFDLTSTNQDRYRLQWEPPTNWKPKFESVRAGVMYVRKLAPGESYWWSG